MYAPGEEGNVRKITGLFTYYFVLNRMFRKTIAHKDGDLSNISSYAKDLLARMRDGAQMFSVIDFMWEEIKGISMNPLKNCGYAPCLMFLIEDATGRDFPKDLPPHKPLRLLPIKKPRVPPAALTNKPIIPPTAATLRPPRSYQQPQHPQSVRLVWVSLPLLPVKNPPLPLPSKCSSTCYLACASLNMQLK
jgi:hypothetical protein